MPLLPALRIALLSLATALAPTLIVGCDDATPQSPTAPSLPEHKQQIRVTGRLIDFTTKAGVAGAPLRWASQQVVATLITDATGFYSVELPYQPAYEVVMTRGTTTIFGTVRLPGVSLSVEENFYVNPGECHSLYGRVIDRVTRAPVNGARISWAGGAATSAADGTYQTFDDCRSRRPAIGTTVASVSHPVYEDFRIPFVRAESLWVGFIAHFDWELTPRTP